MKKEVFQFTVSQLIEVLKSFPEDLPVLTSGYESGYDNFSHPTITELKHEPENMYFDGEFQRPDKEDKNTFKAVIIERVYRDD